MHRFLLIFFLVCLFVFTASAQSLFNGRVLENKTRIVLNAIRIENLNNKLKTLTREDGTFSIAAKTGDLIVFKGTSYQPDTLLLTDMHEREVFLELQKNMLNQVTITDTSGQSVNAEKNMKYFDPQFHGQTMVYHRNSRHEIDGGVILRLHYFKKGDHDKKKAQQKEEERILSEEISTIFTEDNIGHYIPLQGKDLYNFVLLYTPTIDVYNNSDFNLLSYLNTSYQAWLKLPEDKRQAADIFKKQ